MKKILVLRSSRVEHVKECLEQLKIKFPDSQIYLLVQSQLKDEFIWCDEVIVYQGGMFNFSLMRAGGKLLKQLRQQEFDLAVVPTAYADNRLAANTSFFQAGLLCFFSGIKKIAYFDSSSQFFTTTFSRLIGDKGLELVKIGLAPFYWVGGCLKLGALRGEIVGLANIPNDLLAHLVKARWIKKYGLFGLAYDSYSGNPYGLFYPPGSFWLLRLLGVNGFYFLVILLFTGGFLWLAVLLHNPWLLLLLPYLICSPAFKTNVLIAGRVEPIGWALIFLMLCLIHANQYLFCLPVLFALIILIHAGPALLGGVSLLLFAIFSNQAIPIVISLGIGLLTTSFWWLPFLLNQKKLSFKDLRKLVPILNINRDFFQVELLGCLILCLGLFSTGQLVNLVLLLPILIYSLSIFGNRYIFHLGSLQMWVLTLGGFLVCLNPTWLTTVSYLVYLYLSSPFCPRYGFEIRPVRLEQTRDKIEELVKGVPSGSRIGLEFQDRWAEDIKWNWIIAYCLADKDYELCSGVSFDQVELSLITGLEMKINSQEEKISEVLKQAGASYVIAFSKKFEQKLKGLDFELIAQTICPDLGLIKGRSLTLLKAPFEVSLIEPWVEFKRQKNLITFEAKGSVSYLIKYSYYPGWRAFQGKKRIPIVDAWPGMKIKPPTKGEVKLKYKHRYYLGR